MSRKKRVEIKSEVIQNNPFSSLALSFSNEQLQEFEESKEAEETSSEFSGGVVKVRLEKKGRGGKSVTVFYGFEKDQNGLESELLSEMKKALATGGKLTEDGIELQGDLRKKCSEWLTSKGYKVKGQIS